MTPNRLTWKHLEALTDVHEVQIRAHTSTLYWSMFRLDDDLLANHHLLDVPRITRRFCICAACSHASSSISTFGPWSALGTSDRHTDWADSLGLTKGINSAEEKHI